jgi:hexosaminidase
MHQAEGRFSSMNTALLILPRPQSVSLNEGMFYVDEHCFISGTGKAHICAQTLAEDITKQTGFRIGINEKNARIFLLIEGTPKKRDESYRISIAPNTVRISSASENGLFRASRTFLQLVMLSRMRTASARIELPCAEISDHPAFAWRGLNLDCVRHFISKEYIKRTIDVMALYRMNVLHLHLTDDQGWRLEIKKYPKLTEIGAWRESGGKKYGGYYTQDDMKEIIAYAARRRILIVPEIEMPGHAQAAIASYPNLSCTGKPIGVSTRWGIHKDVFCAGKEETFSFLHDVLDEVIELFPSPYIHVGGDECLTLQWKRCPHCRKRMRDEGIADEKALQGYFIGRIASYVTSKGKTIIGWDEIIEGGLPEDAIVQSWRGFGGAEFAASSGRDTIVSPTSHCYFDYGLTYTNLEKVYSFSPIPRMLPLGDESHILGSEACMWTEFVPEETIDHMLYPRLLALSEALWTHPHTKDFNEFIARLRAHYLLCESLGITVGPESESYFSRLRYNARMAGVFFSILMRDPEAAWENLTHYQPAD